MSGGGDDVLIGRHFSGDLNRHVRLALVVEHHQLVFVLRLGIRVAQLDREIGRIAPPMPLTETPPVSGPMKPTFTLSLAFAAPAQAPAPQP
jgi:hypothetical protein